MSSSTEARRADRFGNEIDAVGYARGRVLASSIDETRRLRNGQRIAAERVSELGPESISIFTGNQREFPLLVEDLRTLAEEWVGPSLTFEPLHAVAVEHLGGRAHDGVAVFNRTTAGIVASILAFAHRAVVVSVVPDGDRSHASVFRGGLLAGATVLEFEESGPWRSAIESERPALVIATPVTSSLAVLPDAITREVMAAGKSVDAVAFLDEAYGARLRPILLDGDRSLQLGADLAITNSDKAGLSGPRAGVMVGSADLVTRAAAAAAELGMEARAPIAAGVLRALQGFDPQHLRAEAEEGQQLGALLRELLGDVVTVSLLGPSVSEEHIHAIVHERANIDPRTSGFVPAETASVLGALLLERTGILTVNTHGQPGARVSLRLKPTHGAVERIGGADAVVEAVDAALHAAATLLHHPDQFTAAIVGPEEKSEA